MTQRPLRLPDAERRSATGGEHGDRAAPLPRTPPSGGGRPQYCLDLQPNGDLVLRTAGPTEPTP